MQTVVEKESPARSRRTLWMGLVSLLLVGGGLTTWYLLSGTAVAPAEPPQSSGAVVKQIEFVTPGTAIGNEPPEGWSHLLLKSQPRLSDETKKKVNGPTARLAVLLFTTMTADVKSEQVGNQKKYYLTRLGIGAGTRVKDKNIVIAPDSEKKLGADLGILGRTVLSEINKKQKEIKLVAISRTTAVFDTPAFMEKDRKHQAVTLRYIVLVDENTGKLETLVWRVDRDAKGNNTEANGKIEWLPANKQEDCEMQVDTNEISFGIVKENAFAIKHIPQGQKQFDIPAAVKKEAAAGKLSSDEARALDKAMRELIRK